MPFYAVGQTGVPFGIIDVVTLPINAAQLNGQSGYYYRDASNITGNFTSGSGILRGDASGRFANVDIGSGLLYENGTLHATGAGGGEASGGTGSFSGFFTGVFYTKQVYDEVITVPSGYNGLLVGPVGINSNSSVEAGGNLVVI